MEVVVVLVEVLVVEAFTTSARRNCALLPFRVRNAEGFPAAKNRMHRVLSLLSSAKQPIPNQPKPMWIGVSKSKLERAKGAHCGLVGALFRQLLTNDEKLTVLEHDYGQGTSWRGESMVACATNAPPRIDSWKVVRAPREGLQHEPWIDVSACAHELQMTFKDVEQALNLVMRRLDVPASHPVSVAGWNVAGCTLDSLPVALQARDEFHETSFLCLQEARRGTPGQRSEWKNGPFSCISQKTDGGE